MRICTMYKSSCTNALRTLCILRPVDTALLRITGFRWGGDQMLTFVARTHKVPLDLAVYTQNAAVAVSIVMIFNVPMYIPTRGPCNLCMSYVTFSCTIGCPGPMNELPNASD
jgi:hypothetical protein